MSDQNMEKKKTPVLGILSTVAGGVSMVPFLGVVSPIGLILGVIGLVKETPKLMSIIGTSVSALGLATSPVLWGIVACTFNPQGCKDAAKNTPTAIEAPASQPGQTMQQPAAPLVAQPAPVMQPAPVAQPAVQPPVMPTN